MKKIYLLWGLTCLLFSACEGLIEVDAPNNQIGTAQVFEDVKTANAALGSLYAGLRDQSFVSGNLYGTGASLGSYADDLVCYYNDQNGLMDIYNNLQQQTNTNIKAMWTTAYSQIYTANSIVYGAEHSTSLSDANKNRIRGEALLARSLVYFYLQQLFGDIPYTTSLDYQYNRALTKTSASALLAQLEADLKESATLLQDSYRDTERIYPNRKAAQLLLARLYLTEQKYGQAEQLADSILQSPLYIFQSDINEVFHKAGKHILWQLKPQNSGDPAKEASFYYFTNAAPNNVYTLSDDLVNSFSDNDLRKQAWMGKTTFNGNSWYRPYKYKNLSGNTNEYSVLLRLEEAYFIKAEALAKQNRIGEALPYLNATRERAGLDAFTSLSETDFFNELLAEKRREFFAEFGQRFLDLKRFGRLGDLSTTKPNWESYKAVWPLPQSELLLNSNLYPQNSGY
jgi:starch-binding outer membrane protein, SusD/RagB family